MRERERETDRQAKTQAEGEAGFMQGGPCGTPTQISRITPWAEGSAKLLSHAGCALPPFLIGHLARLVCHTENIGWDAQP